MVDFLVTCRPSRYLDNDIKRRNGESYARKRRTDLWIATYFARISIPPDEQRRTAAFTTWQLQVDDNVIIKPSDRSKGFVVLSKSSYVDKCNQLLGDSST